MEENKTLNFNKIQNLKHGENVHQNASLYSYDEELDWVLLNGSEITYSNFINASLALKVSAEFFDVSAITIVKNNTICSVALAENNSLAFDKALDSDPIAPFGATIAFTKEINGILARKLSEIPTEMIIAPSFEENALEILMKRKNLKLIKINTPIQQVAKFNQEEVVLTPFGALIQEKDNKDLDVKTFKVATKKKPQQSELEDMIFAFKVAKHLKTSGIVIAKDLRTLGISSCQANTTDSLQVAINKVCDSLKDAIVACDCAINSINDIQIMAQERITGLIQPMGSLADNEIIQNADKLEISIVSTGLEHIKY